MTITLTGHCTCGALRYSASLDSADAARTSLCHCGSCRRAFGTNYGLTTKVSHLPISPGWTLLTGQGTARGLQVRVRKAEALQAGERCDSRVLRQLRRFHLRIRRECLQAARITAYLLLSYPVGTSCKDIAIRHVGYLRRTGQSAAQGRVLLQRPRRVDARDTR